jgi:diguanylate cyclase (GGDEF)-like protein
MRVYSNLWKTYGFIVVSSMVTALVMSYISWLEIKDNARIELEYANKIVTHSMQQVLNKDEALLEVLGARLIELEAMQQPEKSQVLINELLRKNPDLAGIGLADPSGQLIITSFNIDRENLPNLLTTPETRASFKRAMAIDAMVIGRTYFMKALQTWVIPLRYRITDEQGEVLAVMTTGLKLNSTDSIWSGDNLPEHVQLSVIRPGYYRQYTLNIDVPNMADWYNEKIPQHRVDDFFRVLQTQTGHDAESLITTNEVISLISTDAFDQDQMTAISYDPTYEQYTLVHIPMGILYARMLVPTAWLMILLLAFNVSLYFIFRFNNRLQDESTRKLEFQARHDLLTNLPNRRFLLEEFKGWQQSRAGVFSVLFIDLDDFKISNDLHGHSVGDRILKEVVQRIKAIFTECLNVRQGGDQFIILCKVVDEAELTVICKRFFSVLQQPIIVDELEFSIRASIGVSRAPVDGSDIDELLRKADMAMYRAKNLKSGVSLYSKDLEVHAMRVAKVEKELRHALARNEFSVLYQPQVRADNQSVVGVEALLRWHNAELGEVSPNEFISIAESTGLIKDIGKYVFETALSEMIDVCEALEGCGGIYSKGVCKLRLSVNVSVQQLLDDSFSDFICAILYKHGEAGLPVMIEVTESIFIHDLDKTRLILQKIKQSGVGISLDDFGSGYSSLNILNKLPISELKIDKEFVRDILSDDQDLLLIQSIISISKSMGIPVLAEGVESSEQARVLTDNGCDLYQGFYFSKPLNKENLTVFLAEHKK